MFAAFCPDCARRQLIFPSQVIGIRNDERGIHVVYRCSRDHVAEWVTGRLTDAA